MDNTTMPDLFSDGKASDSLCTICGLDLGEQVVEHKKLDGKAHLSCVKECVGAGDFHHEEVISMEKSANLKGHPLLASHPDVVASGCTVCRKTLFDDDLVIVTRKESHIVTAHRQCIGSYISIDKNPAVLVSLARMNEMPWDSLLPRKLGCKSCGNLMTSQPLVVAGALHHVGCVASSVLRGEKLDIPSTAAVNGLTETKLSEMIESWKRIFQTAALKREADGMLSQVWEKFKGWVSSMWSAMTGVDEAYDQGIQALESVTEQGVESHIKRAHIKEAIDPEVQKSMDLLADLEKEEKDRKQRLADIAQRYEATNLSKAKSEASQKVADYLKKLKSKQRRYGEALFRFKNVAHRARFAAGEFRDAVKALFTADAAMSERISALQAEATKGGFTSQEVEVLMEEPEVHPQTQQLQQEGVPTEGQPTPQRTESNLFSE